MKAKDLMIGDWVHNFITNENYQIWPQFFSQVYYQDKEMERDLADAHIHPIPLTAEILEKNGWKYNELPFIQGWEQFGLLLYAGGEGYRINCGNNVAMRIDAVHELQHALRLCGIDKEIVI